MQIEIPRLEIFYAFVYNIPTVEYGGGIEPEYAAVAKLADALP